jgi:membrane-bound lytic murein transglycosylase D
MKMFGFIFLTGFLLVFSSNTLEAQNVEVEKVFERIETVWTPIPLNFQTNQKIEQYITYYQGRGKPTMEVGIYRYGVHERMIRRIFNEEGVPEDLSWIPQVERMWDGGLISSNYLIIKDAIIFNRKSKKQNLPRPLWIFPPNIAKKYDLQKTKYLDETRSFEKATRAMALYLKFLYEKYDKNWELAIGAYESGEGNIDLAIKRAKAKDYWAIYKYLPRDTRNFVPSLLAAILIAKNQSAYGFGHIRFAPQMDYEILRVQPSLSLWTIADLADVSIDYIRYLNPEFLVNITPHRPYLVRVPMGKGEIIAEKLRGRK